MRLRSDRPKFLAMAPFVRTDGSGDAADAFADIVGLEGLNESRFRRSAGQETQRRVPAMGSQAHLVIHGDPRLVDGAVDRLAQLEDLWSRFLPDSDISRINRAEGAPTRVAAETIGVLQLAVAGWNRSGGLFDPTLGVQMNSAGYDQPRNWEDWEIRPADSVGKSNSDSNKSGPAPSGNASPQSGAGLLPPSAVPELDIDSARNTVTLPAGYQLDLGGIGKGAAADLIVTKLIDQGADGALANIGGDVRVSGLPADGGSWRLLVAETAVRQEPLATATLSSGGLATSTTRRRRWTHDGHQVHHLLDPSTGYSTDDQRDTAVVLASVIAHTAAGAEVATKSFLVAGPNAKVEGVRSALLVTADGALHRRGEAEELFR
ncbi:MAG: FAD:protein FMN transferase [Acidimicrobiia bacterium]|nr:FAD:protein FMN transferase [Acidimicrobiia bacterium]